MKKYQLAVAVKEQEYLKRLADYVRDSPLGGQWQVTAFTHAEACRQYMKQGYKIDLLVAQPELLLELKEDREWFPAIPTVALVLKLGESDEEHELHQYQSLPLLLQRISEIHARTLHSPGPVKAASEETTGVKKLAVYSASGGVGKTGLALHLVHAASSHGYRTFYLNLEKWNSSDRWLGLTQNDAGGKEGEGLSELLYSLKSQPEQAVRWLMEHRRYHPLLKGDDVAPCSNMEDRMTLGPEDALSIVNAVTGSGQYDLIVIDLDTGLEDLHAALFEQSDQVLWVMNDDASVQSKQAMALRYAEQKWGERFARLSAKFLFIKNQTVHAARSSLHESDKFAFAPILLPEVPEWRGAASVTLLTSPLFRAAADRLFKYIYHEEVMAVADR